MAESGRVALGTRTERRVTGTTDRGVPGSTQPDRYLDRRLLLPTRDDRTDETHIDARNKTELKIKSSVTALLTTRQQGSHPRWDPPWVGTDPSGTAASGGDLGLGRLKVSVASAVGEEPVVLKVPCDPPALTQ